MRWWGKESWWLRYTYNLHRFEFSLIHIIRHFSRWEGVRCTAREREWLPSFTEHCHWICSGCRLSQASAYRSILAISLHVCHCVLIVIQYQALYCRIHVLAGLLNDSISTDEAEKTFISNIRQAADECSKVVTACYFHCNSYTTCIVEVFGPPSAALHWQGPIIGQNSYRQLYILLAPTFYTVHIQHGITILIEPLMDNNYFLCHQDQGLTVCMWIRGTLTLLHISAIDLIKKIGRPNIKIEFVSLNHNACTCNNSVSLTFYCWYRTHSMHHISATAW